MLKIENLSTSYKTIDGDVHVLKDINFEIKDNEIFGIAGESGCGKTTLLNTLYDIVDYLFHTPLNILKIYFLIYLILLLYSLLFSLVKTFLYLIHIYLLNFHL